MQKIPVVYIITNQKYGALYIGVARYLIGRIWQHKNNSREKSKLA